MIGGGNVGLDVVEFFVPRKADVTIVEQKAHFGENLDFITKTGSIEFMNKNKVNQYPNASLLEVKDHSFIVRHDYKDLELDFDYGFVCLGMQSATPSLQELYNHFIYEGVEVPVSYTHLAVYKRQVFTTTSAAASYFGRRCSIILEINSVFLFPRNNGLSSLSLTRSKITSGDRCV